MTTDSTNNPVCRISPSNVVGEFRLGDFLARLCYTRDEWGYHYLILERTDEDSGRVETMTIDSLDDLGRVVEAAQAMVSWRNEFTDLAELNRRLNQLGLMPATETDGRLSPVAEIALLTSE
jgi:hypothetical protein